MKTILLIIVAVILSYVFGYCHGYVAATPEVEYISL
jgi:hypothetical protein